MRLILAIILFASQVHASLINGGFEDDLAGWTISDPQSIVDEKLISTGGMYKVSETFSLGDPSIYHLDPVAGDSFLRISTVSNSYLWAEGEWQSFATQDKILSISQSISLNGGDTISGNAAYFNGDFYTTGDKFYIKIYDGQGAQVATPWNAHSGGEGGFPGFAEGYGDLGFLQGTPWTAWSWTASTSDEYRLEISAFTGDDYLISTHAFFDGIQVQNSTAVVPEPATLALFSLGAGLVALARRRMAAA